MIDLNVHKTIKNVLESYMILVIKCTSTRDLLSQIRYWFHIFCAVT